MTLKEFAKMLDGREYGKEITKEEEALAKQLGFVVVFGYSDDCAELRGAIFDELGCFDGGVLKHDDLPDTIYADWCPEDIECSWAYGTPIPHEKFHVYDDGYLYCVGIVCDINKPPMTNGDRIRAMTDEELVGVIACPAETEGYKGIHPCLRPGPYKDCESCIKEWLQQPVKEDAE